MRNPTKSRNDKHLAELERNCSDSAPERGKVVFVIAGDFFDEPMFAKSSDDIGYLTWRLPVKKFADIAVSEAADIEFTPNDRDEDVEIVTVKKIEATIGTLIGPDGAGNLLQIADTIGGIINRGEKLDIAAIGIAKYGCELRQAVDGFFEWREFQAFAAVTVYHLAVVFKERDIVGRRFDAQDKAVFVIHLDSGLAHMVLDTCTLYAGVKIIAEFIFKAIGEFAAQKHGNLFRLDSMDCGADEVFVKRLKVSLAFEHDVCGIFNLHNAPVIPAGKTIHSGAICADYLLQRSVQKSGVKLIGKSLSCGDVCDTHESVVPHRIVDSLAHKLARKDGVSIAIELQPKGRPGGNTQVAQPVFRMYEIEIVVQALALRRFEKGRARVLIMPRLEGIARFHRREDMHESGMFSSLPEYLFYALLFAKILLLDEVDLHTIVPRNFLSVRSDIFPNPVCPHRVLEYENTLLPNKPCHGLGMSNGHQRAGYHDPIKARKRKDNLLAMTFDERVHGHSVSHQPCYSKLQYAA